MTLAAHAYLPEDLLIAVLHLELQSAPVDARTRHTVGLTSHEHLTNCVMLGTSSSATRTPNYVRHSRLGSHFVVLRQ